jgi:hypothetical protein
MTGDETTDPDEAIISEDPSIVESGILDIAAEYGSVLNAGEADGGSVNHNRHQYLEMVAVCREIVPCKLLLFSNGSNAIDFVPARNTLLRTLLCFYAPGSSFAPIGTGSGSKFYEKTMKDSGKSRVNSQLGRHAARRSQSFSTAERIQSTVDAESAASHQRYYE